MPHQHPAADCPARVRAERQRAAETRLKEHVGRHCIMGSTSQGRVQLQAGGEREDRAQGWEDGAVENQAARTFQA